ncbi:signal transduction histidine kinase [Fictibacillus macauensis ZFHKF-1]|uniref:histidine kinase n=1 Tax=Fictibacillus macauensis ZFHKF-1 TaxID=1196324 RepID=I8J6A0_9BACL|nr:HAMP domain-containing sensor histidine kinase [Fictibacillus macauensis]EIT87341.1 signal transduction histidine kinase [Fictibacillus macauensis ZFHKF-1]
MLRELRKKLIRHYSGSFFITLVVVLSVLFLFVKNMLYATATEDINDILHYEKKKITGEEQMVPFTKEKDRDRGRKHAHLYYVEVIKNGKATELPRGHIARSKEEQAFRAFAESQSCCQKQGGTDEWKEKDGREEHFVYASLPLSSDSFLIVGKDISSVHEKVEHWFFVLALIGMGALVLSVIMGDRLARKAMKPIIRNVESQKAFVADASHELRTPLSIFSASLEVLAQEEKETLSEFSKETLTEMQEEVRQMSTLVDRLLLSAKMEEGGVALHKEVFSLRALIGQVLANYEKKEKHTRLHFTCDDNDFAIEADVMRMKELLYILIDNSLKYSNDSEPVTLSLTYNGGHRITLAVRDRGPGITEENLPFLFDRFYRAEKGRSKKTGGVGLGLAIAKAIVDQHGGKLSVQSTVGEGTTFTVQLVGLR